MGDRVPTFLTFDVEDPVTPASDDALLSIADMLGAQGVPAAFFLTGDKARVLAERRRTDVLDALRPHDVGYHSDRHSAHPTISEYLEELGWTAGVEEVVRREADGVELLRSLTGRELCGFATPGTTWGPQLPAALGALGMPAHVHSFSRTEAGANPHWYAGALCFGRTDALGPIEDSLLDRDAFARMLEELWRRVEAARDRGSGLLHLYVGHPTMFVHREFWDAVNYADGANPPAGRALVAPAARPAADRRSMTAALAELVRVLKRRSADVELVSFAEIVADRRRPRPACTPRALATAITTAAARDEVPTDLDFASPAELTHLMCQVAAGRGLGREVTTVLGPTSVPEPDSAWPADLPGAALAGLAADVCRSVEEHGCLPGCASDGGARVPIGALYRTLVALGAERLRAPGDTVPVAQRADGPAIGHAIEHHFETRARRWLHRPTLDTGGIARLARLQAWSLRASA